MKKLTPVIVVSAIEPILPFWTDRLGFEVTAQVPHGDALGFVILARGGVEVMYQTRASVEEDLPAMAEEVDGQRTPLFIEVEGGSEAIDALERALDGVDRMMPRRTTFYGMDELHVRAPCGTVVGFAAKVATED